MSVSSGSKFYTSIIHHISSQVQDFYTEDKRGKKIKRQNFVSKMQLHLYSFILDCVETIRGRILQLGNLPAIPSCTLHAQMDQILSYIRSIPSSSVKISEQQKHDLLAELKRFFALANLLEMQNHENIRNAIVNNQDELKRDFDTCMNEILCLNPFDTVRSDAVDGMLKQIEVKLKDTINLREMIRMAMQKSEHQNPQGHWYKCRKGHYYYIANCGQANQSGTCPECKERIGGGGINFSAPEMFQ